MKKIILLLLLFVSFNTFGQVQIQISLDNLEPRVGESVTLRMTPDVMTSFLQNELENSVEVSNNSALFDLMQGDYKTNITFQESKKYKLGPYKFEFNKKKYITNSIEVNVRPKMADVDGLFVRLIEKNGITYIELEQRFTNNSETNYNLNMQNFKNNQLAELNLNLTEGIVLENGYSKSSAVNDVTNSTKSYKVNFADNFKGSYTLKEKDFKNLPGAYQLGKIELKK